MGINIFNIKKHIKPALVFLLIILIATLTRFYMLGKAPAGLYLDEAGIGYSAYSILLTGKDEFGKTYPIVFRGFTDFKTPIYIYLVVPLIPVFGLTQLAVRFPSFIFSLATFPVLYFLIKTLNKTKEANKIALLSLLLLAISPWHIIFGRTSYECTVALFFFLSGVLVFYKSLQRPKLLIICSILFAIAITGYHAQRVITPLMMSFLFIRHKGVLLDKAHLKFLIVGSVLGFILLIPTLSVVTTPGFQARLNGLNIFSHSRQNPSGYLEEYKGPFSPLVNSSLFLSTKEFTSLYVSYFSPRYMFLLGDSGPRSSYPYLGSFFIWQFPFYIIGMYKFLRQNKTSEFNFFFLTLLIISPIPAAITRDPYSTIRSLQMVIPLVVVIAIGLIYVYKEFQKKVKLKSNLTAYTLLTLLVTFSLAKLYSSGIVLNEFYRGSYWNYGWRETAEILKQRGDTLPVIIDNAREEPYVQLAFFLKYPPEKYQTENFEANLSEYYTNMSREKTKYLGEIVTRSINWDHDLEKEQYLIGDAIAISDDQIKTHNLKLISDIKYPNGEVAIRIVKTTLH